MLEAEIALRYASTYFAKSVKESLSPDNKSSSEGSDISTKVNQRILTVKIQHVERVETLQATLQDMFRCIRAAESSLSRLTR